MKDKKGSGAKAASKDKAKKSKADKPAAKPKPVPKKKKAAPIVPWTIKVHYPGVVEVVGRLVERTSECVVLRHHVKRSRGKVQDTVYPAKDIVAIFSANAEETTLCIRVPHHVYTKFEAVSFEAVGGMYRITDEEGYIHLVHPDFCTAAQLHDADNAPPIGNMSARVVEDDEAEEEDDEDDSDEEDEEAEDEGEEEDESQSEEDEEEDDEDDEDDDAPPFDTEDGEEDEGDYE